MTDLSGRRAVVTGGARGLGRAIAERLAAAGASILVVDLAGGDLPAGWASERVDLTSPLAPAALRTLAARLGQTAIVVANAGGVPPWRGVEDLDAAEWHRVMSKRWRRGRSPPTPSSAGLPPGMRGVASRRPTRSPRWPARR